jgi:Fur family ferric uptake transcriptional regulator
MASLKDRHVTAAQIAEHLGKNGFHVGLTTVYRHLDRLIASGKARKYFAGGLSGACYQYTGDGTNAPEHFHLKCDTCGALVHLRCGMLNELPGHLYEEHAFLIDKNRVIFYGKCSGCLDKDKLSQA